MNTANLYPSFSNLTCRMFKEREEDFHYLMISVSLYTKQKDSERCCFSRKCVM